VTAAKVLLVGTGSFHGVAACMWSGLRERGVAAQFLEISPKWSANALHRGIERACPWASPRVLLANARLVAECKAADVRWAIVTNGRELSVDTIRKSRTILESRGGGIACFLCDDPFNPVHRSESWLRSLPAYSLVVSTKRQVTPDLIGLGCPAVRYARFAFHPPIHRPIDRPSGEFGPVDIAFAGASDPDRLPFLEALAQVGEGLSVRMYIGTRRVHPALRSVAWPYVRGLDYSAAMVSATVCPCLVRRANRDGHVMRSIELPAMGAFMLAERTSEHQEIFEEGVHCDYWGSREELVEKARWYSRNPGAARSIARRGYDRVALGGFTYSDRALEIVTMTSEAVASGRTWSSP
jgi:spore maturation protein CgeB